MAQSRSFASIGPLCGIDFSLQSAPKSSSSVVVLYPHLSLTSKPIFSLGVKCTGSASERLVLKQAFYKWTNAIQKQLFKLSFGAA